MSTKVAPPVAKAMEMSRGRKLGVSCGSSCTEVIKVPGGVFGLGKIKQGCRKEGGKSMRAGHRCGGQDQPVSMKRCICVPAAPGVVLGGVLAARGLVEEVLVLRRPGMGCAWK